MGMMQRLDNPVPLMRQLSLRAVMETVLHRGPISRSQIARETGLSKQTISEVMRVLEEAGWVRETGRTHGAIGRSAVNYEVRHDAAFVLGIDLGGSKVIVALADLACSIVDELVEPTDLAGGQAILAQIVALRDRLVARSGIDAGRIKVAVLGSPGVLDPVSGSIRLAPNIPDFDGFDVRGALEAALGCPVRVENDVNLGVIGEHWQGRGRDAASLVFMAIGTGIGAGVLVDGKLLRGARGAAGEVSYLPLGGDPFDPELRAKGVFEAAAAATGIVARYAAAGGTPGLSVRDIFDRAAAGDTSARDTLAETARLLAQGIAAICAVVDPERVVLGGSIGIRPEMRDLIEPALRRCLIDPPPVECSSLGNRATLIGALAVGLNRLHNALFGANDLPGELPLPVTLRMLTDAA